MKAVIFDIDNTLYSYKPCNLAAEESMLGCVNKYVSIESVCFQKILAESKGYVKQFNRNTAACHNRMLYSQRMCELLGIKSAAAVLEIYNSYWDRFLDTMCLYDGVMELFAFLREKGIKIAFCSDLTQSIQLRKLVRLGLDSVSDVLVTSEECGREKPDSIMFATTLNKLGVSANDAVMVGDDFKKDVCGAAASGIYPIWLTTENEVPDTDISCCVADNFLSLKNYFERRLSDE